MFNKLMKKKNTKTAKPKKSFNVKEFIQSLQNLDMQNYGSWPLAVKVFMFLVIAFVIAALAYALPISDKREEIKAAEAEQETLLATYKEKESKARHLEEYKAQIVQMEAEFKELLNQLPKDTRVPELIKGINMTGVGSNIKFQDISVGDEVQQDLFIEQPIRIVAVGNYHQFGSFISGLAALPRIITMHDFELTNPQPSLDSIPELKLVLDTKTYRSKDTDATATSTEAAGTNGGE